LSTPFRPTRYRRPAPPSALPGAGPAPKLLPHARPVVPPGRPVSPRPPATPISRVPTAPRLPLPGPRAPVPRQVPARQPSPPTVIAPVPARPSGVPQLGPGLVVPATGREVFSEKLQPGVCYRVVVSGVYSYSPPALFFKRYGQADAVYLATAQGNFSARYYECCDEYHGVQVNGRPLPEQDSYTEDRHSHEYSFLVEGKGERLAFQLFPPKHTSSDGSLSVSVRVAPAGVKTSVGRADENARRAQREEKLERLRAQYGAKVAALQAKVREEGNFLDPAFCRDFLAKHQDQLLHDLRHAWEREHQHTCSDPGLIEALRAFAPEVLTWFDRKIELVNAAERQAVMLPEAESSATSAPRQLTATTLPFVEQAIAKLFRLTEQLVEEGAALAGDRNENLHRPELQRLSRQLAFWYGELRRFGIDAATPEEAEIQMFPKCPPPVPSIYEEMMQRMRAGEKLSPDPLVHRLQDLSATERKFRGWRQSAIYQHRLEDVDMLDRRLESLRHEVVELKSFLDSIGCAVDLRPSRPPEQREPNLEEQIMRLSNMEKRLKEHFASMGQPERAEQLEAMFANEVARLFAPDDETY
jgi:hypothetical protein